MSARDKTLLDVLWIDMRRRRGKADLDIETAMAMTGGRSHDMGRRRNEAINLFLATGIAIAIAIAIAITSGSCVVHYGFIQPKAKNKT